MSNIPKVSIVMAVFNDEEYVSDALASCLAQTIEAIEVVCVDDASTDNTCKIIEDVARRDPRVRLIRQETNRSAFQARRIGIEAARSQHVLFIDGDDQLHPSAAEKTLAKAHATGADLVGFGVDVIGTDGKPVIGYQTALQPAHRLLEGDAIVRSLFPAGWQSQGQLWRYLYRRELILSVYRTLPTDLVLPRANDQLIAILVAATAKRYASIKDHLYRYEFRRGGSGHTVNTLEQFEFYLGAIDSIRAIESQVKDIVANKGKATSLAECYASTRLSVISTTLGYLPDTDDPELLSACLGALQDRISEYEIVLAAAQFRRSALDLLAAHGRRIEVGTNSVKKVLINTSNLSTGGITGVVISQAKYLLAAGYEVVIGVRGNLGTPKALPDGVKLHLLPNGSLIERLKERAEYCRNESIDLIIDHHVLYTKLWPADALIARAVGVPTIGWIHNFALRPLLDQKPLLSFLTRNLNALATLVVLSAMDVTFWKSRGIGHTVTLPNPPSPLLLDSSAAPVVKASPNNPIQLIWWGRLEQHTKQILDLIKVAAELKSLDLPFHLSIIGPRWHDLKPGTLTTEIAKRGLSKQVSVIGELRGDALIEAIDAADIFVNTSLIEGYPLVLVEAQARGLPIVMYDLPWLSVNDNNDGLVSVPQGDAKALAMKIAEIARDPKKYAEMSSAASSYAHQLCAMDFATLYINLLAGTLPAQHSPEPTLATEQVIVEQMILFSERTFSANGNPSAPMLADAFGGNSFVDKTVQCLIPLAGRMIRRFPQIERLALRTARLLARSQRDASHSVTRHRPD
ncbi:MAG: glycosyltransferase [Promicromonosporaceae bacterium]|nr:glycosyltransferase [Promicromonosporaceae bacterium]